MVRPQTYHMKTGVPAPMAWDDYHAIVDREWQVLLNRKPSPSEREVQTFLQDHPCLIPGAYCLVGNQSGHCPWLCSVIAQAPLPSYNKRVPDFMWIAKDSEIDQPVLIEIEAPGKKWWREDGRPHADLTQALDQLAEWKAWFEVPHNVLAFKAFYGLDRDTWKGRPLKPAYALIYGRREEANRNPALTAKRVNMRAADIVMMTYDRLRPLKSADELFCVKKDSVGITTISVPPTMTWGPVLAFARKDIRNKENAIQANPNIPSARKTFLLSRLDYWDAWAVHGAEGLITVADHE
jgi:hypothetical protein